MLYSIFTGLTLPLFIEVPVPSQESEQSCICLLGVLILTLFLRICDWILEMKVKDGNGIGLWVEVYVAT